MTMDKDSKNMKWDPNETQEDSTSNCISNLPDSILSHIQSFLPTEDIVRTSFLSQRWKSLWFPLSVLNLNFKRFSQNSLLDDQKKRFVKFVDRMIELHKGRNMKELRLNFDISEFEKYSSQVDNWVNFAMTSDSKILEIDFWGGREANDPDYWRLRFYTLPHCSFLHESLKALVLTHCIFRPSQYTSFFTLKTAYLRAVHLPGDSVNEFIANSPCLEVVILNDCVVPAHFKVHVPESKLKRFEFETCTSNNDEDIHSFELNIPNLLYFKFEGIMVNNFCLNHPKNLIHVELKFLDDFTHNEQTNMLRNLLADIDNVKSLILSRSCLKVLNPYLDKILMVLVTGDGLLETLPALLHNLKRLTLNLVLEFSAYDILGLSCLFRRSPNLEILSIDVTPCTWNGLVDAYISDKFDYNEKIAWASFLFPCDHLHHLKTVEIKGFEGQSHEMSFVKVMLRNALVLKEMIFHKAAMRSRYASVKQGGDKNKLKLLKAYQQKTIENLLALRRGSPHAQLLLS